MLIKCKTDTTNLEEEGFSEKEVIGFDTAEGLIWPALQWNI